MRIDLETGRIDLGRAAPEPPTRTEKGKGFGEALGKAMSRIEDTTKAADQAVDDFVVGKVDLHEAMVSMEKADLMLKLGSQIRNKLLDAYQQLMNAGNG